MNAIPRMRILIVDDEQPARFALRRALGQSACEIIEAEDGDAALAMLRDERPELAFLDLRMPKKTGLDVLRELGPAARDLEIIVLTAQDSISTAVECIRLGAADFITKPYEVEQVRAIARRAGHRLELERRVVDLQDRVESLHGCGEMIGISRVMRQLFVQMTKAARSSADLLIRGETGTGKELIAREIHRQSDRADGPFIAVNAAAIPESLTESELFGHVRGAFTGAESHRTGVFEQAHGGTLFLDEIGDMPLAAQTKMLRVLQERRLQPVGSPQTIAIDVRVISATHQSLEDAIANGRFRQDLYYRLKGVELRVPPLRQRPEDILTLAHAFLDRWSHRDNRPRPEFAPAAIRAILSHRWPGNVRELEHAVEAAATMCDGGHIEPADLGLTPAASASDASPWTEYLDLPLTEAKSQVVDALERALISAAMERADGNISAAARQLGMHRQSLQQKLSQLGLPRG